MYQKIVSLDLKAVLKKEKKNQKRKGKERRKERSNLLFIPLREMRFPFRQQVFNHCNEKSAQHAGQHCILEEETRILEKTSYFTSLIRIIIRFFLFRPDVRKG